MGNKNYDSATDNPSNQCAQMMPKQHKQQANNYIEWK